MKKSQILSGIAYLLVFSCGLNAQVTEKLSKEKKIELGKRPADLVQTAIGPLRIPAPYSTESVSKNSKIIDWGNQKPQAPAGFKVTKLAENLENPRNTYIGPNGDIFIAESNTRKSANRITIIRESNGEQNAVQKIFLENLNQPFGMLILKGYFYVANTDGLYRFPYKTGDLKIEGKGEKILHLPAGGYNNHWTRNLLASKDGQKIYVSVGSSSNVGENGMEYEHRRAAILEINTDGSGEMLYASGLRNPVGMDWNPVTGDLWTAVNERDELGDNLVPDYLTSVTKNGWYGWPYSYFGKIQDPRWIQDPHLDLVKKAIIPDVPVGPHTASLGLAFYTGNKFPNKYKNGAFVGQHGSWNRAVFSGYKVVFIPMDKDGKPGEPQDFLAGFIADEKAGKVYGRPVGITQSAQGDLLVCDDAAGIIWKISAP